MRHPWRTTALSSALALTFALVLSGSAAADSDLWLHVSVDGARGESVNVNLPITLIEAALPMIPEEHFRHGRLVIDGDDWGGDHDVSVADLRAIWNELKGSPDMTFVTVEDHGDHVKVAKSGPYLLVDIEDEHGEDSRVRMPMAVVDALLAGDGETLDIRAAVEALAAHGEGELVTVNSDDEQVRVWVDRIPETD